jgi:hypothetical protein
MGDIARDSTTLQAREHSAKYSRQVVPVKATASRPLLALAKLMPPLPAKSPTFSAPNWPQRPTPGLERRPAAPCAQGDTVCIVRHPEPG